jgi:CubicO group peptidase (beta-lactamase class C family)
MNLLRLTSLILGLVVVFASLTPLPAAQASAAPQSESSGFSQTRLAGLDRLFEDHVARGQIAGAVVHIRLDGRLVFEKSYGMQDVEAGTPMPKDAIFRIASMSKAVTTTAAMILYEEGKFLLNDPVEKYLPEFANRQVAVPPPAGSPAQVKYVLVPAKRSITIRDLMRHTAGLTYGDGPARELYEKAGFTWWYFANRDETIGDAVKRLAELPLQGQPGEAWQYGYSTDVLGRLIEVVSGQPLDRFIEERVCKPLGMVDTCFFLPPEKAGRLAPVYKLVDGEIVLDETSEKSDYVHGPRKCFSGGAGLLSTASDYGRLIQMLLNGGELDGVRLLSPKTVELMHTNQTGDKYAQETNAFGLGFWVLEDLGYYGELGSEGAYGWSSAYYPHYVIDPKERLAFLFMTQLHGGWNTGLAQKFKVQVYQALEK